MLQVVLWICGEKFLAISYCSRQVVHLLPTSAVLGGDGECVL